MPLEDMEVVIIATGTLQKGKNPSNFFARASTPEEKLHLLKYAIALEEERKKEKVAAGSSA